MVGDALFPVALAFAVLDGLDGTPTQLGLVLGRAGRADDVPRPGRRRVGRPDVAAPAHARLRPRPRRRAGRARRPAALRPTRELWHLVVLVALYGALRGVLPPGGRRARSRRSCRPASCSRPTRSIGARQERRPRDRARRRRRADRGPEPGRGDRRRRGAPSSVSAAFLVVLREPARRRAPPTHARRTSGPSSTAASPRSASAGGCSPSCRRSAPTTSSRCRACSRSAPVLADRELGGAGGVGGDHGRASASARSPARSSGCAGSRRSRCWPRRSPSSAPRCQPAIIALAGSTAAIAAVEAVAGVAVAIGFTQWETTLGRLIPGRRCRASRASTGSRPSG